MISLQQYFTVILTIQILTFYFYYFSLIKILQLFLTCQTIVHDAETLVQQQQDTSLGNDINFQQQIYKWNEFSGQLNGNNYKIYNIFNQPLIQSLHDAEVFNLTIDTFNSNQSVFQIVSNTKFTNVVIKSVNIQSDQSQSLIQLSNGKLEFNLCYVSLSVSSQNSYLISQQSFGEIDIKSSYFNFVGSNFIGFSQCQKLNIEQSEIHVAASNLQASYFFNTTQASVTGSIITFNINYGSSAVYNEMKFSSVKQSRVSFEGNGQANTALKIFFDDSQVQDATVLIKNIGMLENDLSGKSGQYTNLIAQNVQQIQITEQISGTTEYVVTLRPTSDLQCTNYPCKCKEGYTGIFCQDCKYTYLQDYNSTQQCPSVNATCNFYNYTHIYCNCQEGCLQLENKTCVDPQKYNCQNGGSVYVSGNEILCNCVNNFDSQINCQDCLQGFSLINDVCLQQVSSLNGRCYDDNGKIICTSCNSGFDLNDKYCQQKSDSSVYILIGFTVLMCIILIVAITILAIEAKKGRKPKYLNYDPLKVKKANNLQTYSYMQVAGKSMKI